MGDRGADVVTRGRARIGIVGTVALLAVVAAACGAAPPPLSAEGADVSVAAGRYVSMGDSWVSGPLITDFVGTPIDCGQSSRNWPRLVAAALAVERFRDVSCGGADTDDLWEPQEPTLGIFGDAPPQLDALTADTTLVTIGIGGNDAKFASTALKCVNLLPFPLGPPPFGQPCRDRLTEDGVDSVTEKIAEAREKVDEAFAEIRRRAPRARVLVIGYPTALPQAGPGCWPRVPILPVDVEYLRQRFEDMNAMLAAATARAGFEFVDTYTSSVGHDVCQPTGTAWVNGATLEPLALPMHPNEYSHQHTAGLVLERLGVATPA